MALTLIDSTISSDLSTVTGLGTGQGLPATQGRVKEGLDVAREVLGELGEQALAEVLNLGEVLERDDALRRKLRDAKGAATASQNTQLLSPYISDTIIALHAREQMYATHLMGNKQVSQFHVQEIISAAEVISELNSSSSFHDIVHALECDLGSDSKRAEIWSTFGVSELNTIMELQRDAYFERLRIQPGEHTDLTLANDIANSSYGKSLASLLTVHLVETLSHLSPSQLSQARDLGRRLQLSTIITPTLSEVFGNGPFQLHAENLKLYNGDSGLINFLATAHFAGFRDYKSALAANSHRSFTVETAPLSGVNQTPANIQAERYFNFNVINAYTMARHLSRLPESIVAKLELLAAKNPEPGRVLKIDTKVEEPSGIKRDYFGSQLHHEAALEWQRRVATFKTHQKDKLYLKAQELVKWSDSAKEEGSLVMRDKVFTSGLSLLRELTEQSDYLGNELRIAGRSSVDVSNFFGATDSEIIDQMLRALPDDSTGRLQAIKKRYERTEQQFQGLFAETSPKPSPGVTELIRHRVNDSDWKAVKDIIGATLRPDYDPDYKARGGVVFDYYDSDFIESFLGEGNHLAVHRRSSDGSICGFFMYYMPGRVPTNHTNVPEHIRELSGFSYAQLIAVSPDRPSGTYDKLFRAMMSYAQVEKVLYSEGCVNTSNLRQIQNLIRLQHTPQPLAEYATQPSGQTTGSSTYRPMVLSLHPFAYESDSASAS